jgi:secreted PhoX family phosphatase
VRWTPKNSDHTNNNFDWNLFVLAGNPVNQEGLNKGSKNINKHNMFNSPDGLKFDTKGGLWIQTDGKYSNTGKFQDMGNNQMLLGNSETGEIKRFLVGPKECEITGLTWSVDKKTMFVGVQHPGEKGNSNFPGGAGTTPRSSIVAISRDDNGEIG